MFSANYKGSEDFNDLLIKEIEFRYADFSWTKVCLRNQYNSFEHDIWYKVHKDIISVEKCSK